MWEFGSTIWEFRSDKVKSQITKSRAHNLRKLLVYLSLQTVEFGVLQHTRSLFVTNVLA